jgi:hypothetical protein
MAKLSEADAIEIRDETIPNANTALRVGQHLLDIVQFINLTQIPDPMLTPGNIQGDVNDYNPDGLTGEQIYNFTDVDTAGITNGTYVVSAGPGNEISGGTGVGMVLEITVSGGEITSIDRILDAGNFYTDGDTLTITAGIGVLDGSGTATFQVEVGTFSEANVLRLTAENGNRRIRGIQAPPVGVNRILTIVNIDSIEADNRVELKNNDNNSLPENRFLFKGDSQIETDETFQIWYDHTTQRWRALGARN